MIVVSFVFSVFFPEELVMWLPGKTEFSCLIGAWFRDEKSNETRAPWWVDPSDISLRGSNFPVGRDFRRSWVASPTDHREAQRITFSQICPQKSSSRFLFVYFCFVFCARSGCVSPMMAQSLRPEIFFLDEYQKHDSWGPQMRSITFSYAFVFRA